MRLQKANGLITDFLTVAEVAARWKLSRQRIHQLIVDGRVPAFRAYGVIVLPSSTVKPRPAKKGELNDAAFAEARKVKRQLAAKQRQRRRVEKGRRQAVYNSGVGGVRAALLRGWGNEE